MNIIRDEEMGGIMMIPLFTKWGINRCNIKGCTGKHTTICVHEKVTFGLCEAHYLEGKEKGTMNLKLEFNQILPP
jgi:hypothetical protein